jgi:hypothetical protein
MAMKLELINQKSFLGKEFMTWLWYLEAAGAAPACGVAVEIVGPLRMVSQYGDAREIVAKGDSPATSPEAIKALIEGKRLRKCRVKLTRGSAEWWAALDGESLAFSGVSIANPGRLPLEELATVRLLELAGFWQAIGDLFAEFMGLRLDEAAWARELTRIHAWLEAA